MLYDLADVNKHIVDLKRSKWDPDRSDRERGIYFFENAPDAKVYIKQSDYEDSASRPAHMCKFVDIERVPYYRSKFGAELVTTHDPYWPEPMVPDSEGKYLIMDAVLVKIADIEGYVDHRIAERARAEGGHKESDRKFNLDARADGVGLNVDEHLERTSQKK